MQKAEFVAAVRDAEDTLYRVAMAILRDEDDCGDAVQEALLLAFEKLGTLREEKFFKTWLTRILIHECYRIRKKKKNLVSYEEYVEANEKEAPDADYSELYGAIRRLPEDIRVAVTLFYIEGFSIREIGEMTECGENTVKSRLYRGRMQLRKILDDKEEALC
ncbi:MAG: sigma-70 family RNA polymerase sigma factor [Clostridiales bacterium]|nr:sigma-70 family RNA polymerase sigma factor [Clostridiales bacterium]